MRGLFSFLPQEHTVTDINLSAIVGTKESILEELAQRLTYTANVSLPVCMNEAVDIVKRRAFKYLTEMIMPALDNAYLELCVQAGDPAPDWIFARKENWGDAMDDKLEAVIEPYAHLLSSDWTARYTIGSRLYEEKGKDAWAEAFADEVYKNITYLHKRGEEGAPKTAAQIMSSVGIVADDFDTFMRSRPKASQQQQRTFEMSNLQTTLDKLVQMQSMFGRALNDVAGLVENAMDSDDGLAISGVSQLGGDHTDVATLRLARSQGLTAQALVQAIMTGVPPVLAQAPAPAAPVTAAPPAPPPAAPEMDLSQFMGGAPAPAAPTTADAPPPRRGRGAKQTPTGALPPRVFDILKDHTGIKSEELGAAIGVSRQTFDNYAKGKAHCQPTAENLSYLRTMLDSKIKLLQEAAALLPQ